MTSPQPDVRVNIIDRKAFGESSFLRLDAEFVDAGPLAMEAELLGLGGRTVSAIVSDVNEPKLNAKFAAGTARFNYVSIESVDCTDGLVFPERIAYAERPQRAKYVLEKSDVLVSNVRPNRGAVTLVTERNSGALASSGFTLLRKPKGVSPELLFVFLRSRYGRDQLIRRNRGSMYPAVLERDVGDVVVPTVPSGLSGTLTASVKEVTAVWDEFFSYHDDMASQMDALLTPLGVPPSPLLTSKPGIDMTIISRTNAFGNDSAQRMDAEFFRSEYADFVSHVTSNSATFKLGDYFELVSGRTNSGDDHVPTIKQAVLTNVGVNWSALEMRKGKCKGTQVEAGDVLLASTAHEIAWVGKKVDFVRAVPEHAASCNQAVPELIVLRPRADKPDYLSCAYVAAALRHPFGRFQVQRCIRGLRGGHTYPRDLAGEVILPDPGEEWLDTFAETSSKAEALRQSAIEKMAGAVAELEAWLAT